MPFDVRGVAYPVMITKINCLIGAVTLAAAILFVFRFDPAIATEPLQSVTPSPAYVDAKLQVGPWVPTTWNAEEPFINIIHASALSWEGSGWKPAALLNAGHIDPDTGLITSFPSGLSNGLASTVYYTSADKRFYDGDWVLEWDGDADMHMEFIPGSMQRRVSATRVEFTRDERTNAHARIRVTRLGPGGLTGLRLFRADYEDELNAGQIYAPAFIDNVGRAHVVRTMDLQEANQAYIHRAADVAPMTEHFWNNHAYNDGAASPHRSMPLEAVARLGVEADVEIWHHAPMELGATTDFLDPAIYDADVTTWGDNARTMANNNAAAILASAEWDAYADAFVAALGRAGYPESRTLYTTVGNEVWNTAYQYHVTTVYADGIGRGFGGVPFAWRHGYGVLMGRWMLALEAALERAGRNQNVIYVVEGQAATPDTSRQALAAMQDFVEGEGQAWDAVAPKIGLSVASYWGGNDNWEGAGGAEDRRNAGDAFWARLEERLLSGPDTEFATLPWVLKRFDGHARAAEPFGVRLIGAYEGGSHFSRHKDVPKDAYTAWHWGDGGARVNAAVNAALAERFPGIILSNYATFGPAAYDGASGPQPWFEGLPSEPPTEMAKSWEAYQRQ